jgi:proline iminopeptidase
MADGIELHLETFGTGRSVVWLPGGPGLNNYLGPVAKAMSGFRNILADPRGTGSSEGQPHGLGVAIQDLEDLRRALGLDSWTVVGHSWGADLGLAYGLAHGKSVSSIVSIAGTGVQNDRDWHAAYESRIDEEPHGDYQYNPEVHRLLLAEWRSFIKAPDLLARIAALPMPITFLHGTNDIRPSWPGEQLAHLAPDGRYLELADAPHEAWFTHRDALVRVLREILLSTAP